MQLKAIGKTTVVMPISLNVATIATANSPKLDCVNQSVRFNVI